MKRNRKLLSRVVFVGLVVALMTGSTIAAQTMTAASAPVSAGQAVVEEYFGAVLSNADAAAAEAILAPGFQRTDRSQFGVTLGAPGVMFLAHYQHSAFPDLRYTIDDLVVEGDHAAVCWTAKGTQAGEYGAAAATGKPVVWTGMSFLQLQDGKIAGEVTNLEELSAVLNAEELRISPSYMQ
jgi:predicted ester cyclase